jgi:hypothetical protein
MSSENSVTLDQPLNAAADTAYNDWADWNPKEYNTEYYSEVTLDGRYLMEWVVESVALSGSVPLAIEFGSGPTILHMLPLAPKANEIHVAEYLAPNRAEVQAWVNNEPGTHDWSLFTRAFLQMEGNQNPSDEECAARENELRRKITSIVPGDAYLDDPIGPEGRARYPLVLSLCCADSATNSKETWKLFMKNIASLIAPGGMWIISACGEHSHYKVGECRFPGACISGRDMLDCLLDLGFRDVDVRMREVPDSSGQGFGCTILARAIKPR